MRVLALFLLSQALIPFIKCTLDVLNDPRNIKTVLYNLGNSKNLLNEPVNNKDVLFDPIAGGLQSIANGNNFNGTGTQLSTVIFQAEESKDSIIYIDNAKMLNTYTYSVNSTTIYMFKFHYRGSRLGKRAVRLYVDSPHSVASEPVLFVVRHEKGVLSWQLPLLVQLSGGGQRISEYRSVNRTMCPTEDYMKIPTTANDTDNGGSPDEDFLALSISTASKIDTEFSLLVYLQDDYLVDMNETREFEVTPSAPQYFEFHFPDDLDMVLLSVTSPDRLCMTVSVQNISCPISDLDSNVEFEGIWQTADLKAGMTIRRDMFPAGLHIVFVVKPDDRDCSNSRPLDNGGAMMDCAGLCRNKRVAFEITKKISKDEYLVATFGAFFMFCGAYLVVIIVSCVICVRKRRVPVERSLLDTASNHHHQLPDTRSSARDFTTNIPSRVRQRNINHQRYESMSSTSTLSSLGGDQIGNNSVLVDVEATTNHTAASDNVATKATNSQGDVNVTNVNDTSTNSASAKEPSTNDDAALNIVVKTVAIDVKENEVDESGERTALTSQEDIRGIDNEGIDEVIEENCDINQQRNIDTEVGGVDGIGVITECVDEVSNIDLGEYDLLEDADMDKDVFRTKTFLYVSDLSRKHPSVLKRRSMMYHWNLLTISIFYGLPVVQLVITYQTVLHQTGNEDLCYYNFLCAHPLGLLSDFNHVYSNLGYVMLGGLFMVFVWRREYMYNQQVEENPALGQMYGIPQHSGLFYAMALALIMEGLMSGCYHICPNHSNFQFDTAFMYTIAILCMLKIYQFRHPDINANAYTAFGVLAFVIFIGVIGVTSPTIPFWIFFTGCHVITCLIVSIQIYYMGRWKVDGGLFKRVWRLVKNDLLSLFHGNWRALKPTYPERLFLMILFNIINWALTAFGIVVVAKRDGDFASFLLGVFISNLMLYTCFYIIMKLRHGERISRQPLTYILLSFLFCAPAMYFFLNKSTTWNLAPAQSRHYNQSCRLFHFYDNHDIWHFLSASALFFSFMGLLTIDDDLSVKPRDKIPVF